jgi:hypothetical protein
MSQGPNVSGTRFPQDETYGADMSLGSHVGGLRIKTTTVEFTFVSVNTTAEFNAIFVTSPRLYSVVMDPDSEVSWMLKIKTRSDNLKTKWKKVVA